MESPKFGKEFFDKHQRRLVSFANSWLGRWFFKLENIGIGRDFRIMEIRPNHISGNWRYDLKTNRIVKTTVFLTTPRFSNRLRHVYRMACRFVPQAVAWKAMNPLAGASGALAFLPMIALTTSTFYPDANPETSSVDGWISNGTGANFATVRNATDGDATDAGGNQEAYVNCAYFGGTDYFIRRMFFLFDTSDIGTDAVDSATLSLHGVVGGANTDSYTIDIVSSSPASNTALTTADYDQIGRTVFADIAYASWNTSAYNDFSLNASGIANVSTSGVSKFGATFSGDTDNSTPTGNNVRQMRFADYTGTGQDPKLVVVHSVSATFRSAGGGVSYMGAYPNY